jgi:hypothetical protein
MLRLLLKSGCVLVLAACTVCAQQAAPATKPVAPPAVQPQTSTAKQTTTVKKTTTTTSRTRAKGKRGKKPAVVAAPVAVTPPPPPPPPTPEQLPAAAPQVTYRGGLLSINSQNSTLGDILNAVRKVMGGTIDAPGTTLSERIAARLGPGSPKDVLSSLFSGSRFDYIILGSAITPNGIDRIILSPRQNGSISQAAAQPGAKQPGVAVTPGAAVPLGAPGRSNAALQADPNASDDSDSEEDMAPERDQAVEEPSPNVMPPDQQQQPPPGAQGVPQQQPPDEQGVQPPGSPNATDQQNPQQPKSPEQLLKELQDLQRQRQTAPADQEQNPR